MKILHISGQSHKTGAGRGALWLHEGLLAQNVDSNILFQKSKLQAQGVSTVHNGPLGALHRSLKARSDAKPLRQYPDRTSAFSVGHAGNDLRKHPLYKAADLIHLHWINRGMLSIKQIGLIDKPLVWTLRDMWPVTGGCHYDMGCGLYKTQCAMCPVLGSGETPDLSSRQQAAKQSTWSSSPMHLVSISHWLDECTRQSTVFREHDKVRFSVIPNGVDVEQFFPEDKLSARAALNLPADERVILVGAQNLSDEHKGFGQFLSCLEYLEQPCVVAVFGQLQSEVSGRLPASHKSLGFINSNDTLRLAYSAADVFVAPSLQEAFGKTLVESLACGTPVVCFNTTGPRDIIEHKVHGYRADAESAESLAHGIDWLGSQSTEEARYISAACRDRAVSTYGIDVIAHQYIDLYENVLNNRSLPV